MQIKDNAFDNEQASSVLKALRANAGVRGEQDSINGNAYSTGEYFGSVTDGTKKNVCIQNPADSGVVLFVSGTFRAGGQIAFQKIDSVTIDTAGTTLSIDNRLINDGSSVANAESDVVYSGGNTWTKKTSGGTVSSGGLAPGVYGDFDIILQEGENVVYEFENTAGTTINASIDVDYIELEKIEIDELSE